MTWYRNGGKVLKRVEFGGIATTEDCCCDDTEPPTGDCCCPQFEGCVNSTWTVTLTGTLAGTGTLVEDTDGASCIRWTGSITMDPGDDCAGGIAQVDIEIRCPAGGDTGADDLEIVITSGSADCDIGSLGITDRTCGPPARIQGNFDIVEILPTCQCIGETVFFDAVFNEDCDPPLSLMAIIARGVAGETQGRTASREIDRIFKEAQTLRQATPKKAVKPKPPPLRQFVKELPPEAMDDPDVKRWIDSQEPPQ